MGAIANTSTSSETGNFLSNIPESSWFPAFKVVTEVLTLRAATGDEGYLGLALQFVPRIPFIPSWEAGAEQILISV